MLGGTALAVVAQPVVAQSVVAQSVVAQPVVARLRADVDGLLDLQLSRLSSVELTGLVVAVEGERRRLESVDQRLIAQLCERGVAGEYGCARPADLLVELLRVSPWEAAARVGRSRDLGPRCDLSGQVLAPILAVTSAAVRGGEISAEHARVISRVIEQSPGYCDGQLSCIVERALFHHREFERRGWSVRMNHGRPEWIPPAWLDPDQKPRRNTAHHVLDVDFDIDFEPD